jgi:hypothetical protein
LQPHQHVAERLERDADERRADEVADLRLLQGIGERGDPGKAFGRVAAIAAADHFHLEHAHQVQQQPEREAGIALFAQHLEIGGVIGAALFLDVLGLDRGVVVAGVIGLDRVIAHAVLAERIEAAAERMGLGKFDRPFPHGDAGGSGLVGLVVLDRAHALGEAGGQQRHGHQRPGAQDADIEHAPPGGAQHHHRQYHRADQPGARLRAHRHQQAGKADPGGKQLGLPIRLEDRAVVGQPQRQGMTHIATVEMIEPS